MKYSILIFLVLTFQQTQTLNTICQQVLGLETVSKFWSGRIDNGTFQYSGHFLFYEQPKSDQLLIFIGPGPGSTSMIFNLRGLGPITLQDDDTTQQNTLSPLNYMNVLFLDVYGAGYSRAPPQLEQLTAQQFGQIVAEHIQSLLQSDCLSGNKLADLKLTLLSSGQGVKIAIHASKQLTLQGLILLSPFLLAEPFIRFLPQVALNFGLIDKQERLQIERLALSAILGGITQQSYNKMMNEVGKMSGDMNIHNFFQYKQNLDDLTISRFMNSDDIRSKLNLEGQYFFTHSSTLVQLMQNSFALNDTIQSFSELISNMPDTDFLMVLNTQSLTTNYAGNIHWINKFHWKSKSVIKSLNDVDVTFTRNDNDGVVSSSLIVENVHVETLFKSGENMWEDQTLLFTKMIQGFIDAY